MATITTNTSRLSVVEKCARGQNIIVLGTDNPNVPGNAEALAAFSSMQEELAAASLAVSAAKEKLKQMVIVQNTIEKRWDAQIMQLAGVTQLATKGDAAAIISAGFGVRGANVPTQPLPAPEGLLAKTNGSPGRTKLTWNVIDGAAFYLIEMSPDPIAKESWKHMTTSMRSSCESDGAEPGKRCWFRVAAVNAVGQGPWSGPACREVM